MERQESTAVMEHDLADRVKQAVGCLRARIGGNDRAYRRVPLW